MRIVITMALALAIATPVSLHAQTRPAGASPGPVRFLLVGDSTIAKGSGWGDAFCAELVVQATCVNMAKGGRSSGSYRAEGSWDAVIAEMKKPGPWKTTWVIVSFGHNDQPGKPERSTAFNTEFMPNMSRYVAEVRANGAQPLLLTPLTRRQFRGGLLQDGLSAWSSAIRQVARETDTPLLDLGSDSVLAVQMLGPVKVMEFAQGSAPASVIEAAATGTTIEAPKDGPTPAPGLSNEEVERLGAPKGTFDYTHLGPVGARFFGRMVRREAVAAVPALRAFFRP